MLGYCNYVKKGDFILIGGNSMLFPADVVVDSNEEYHSERVIKELKRLGMRVAVSKLEAGDYFIPLGSEPRGFLIERKRVDDFINSILDSRLWTQAESLSKISKESNMDVVFLIEGDLWDAMENREIPQLAVIRAIDEIVLTFKIPIIYTKDPEMTASWMVSKIKSLRKKVGGGKFLPYVKKKAPSDSERILNSLAVLSGYETARKLLRTYGSLKEVFSLSIEQLKSIEGIGEARAKRLFRLFNLKYEEKEIGAGEKND